jgi:beta-ribofuranosylaminobenzene 5'-phosphate synthase
MAKTLTSAEIIAPSRLHFGLIDCGNATSRQFGGVGCSVEAFYTRVKAHASSKWTLQVDEPNLDQRAQDDLEALITRLKSHFEPTTIQVVSSAPPHMGLGSKTALLSSVVAATFAAHNRPADKALLMSLTKRGGTSGLGVNLFWQGGLIADGGHRDNGPTRIFAPSSARVPRSTPPIVSSVKIPRSWRVALFYDADYEAIDGDKEKQLFTQAMPIPAPQSLAALAAVYHGIIPAVVEGDIPALATALSALNGTGMKAFEVSCQTSRTQSFLTKGWEKGLAVGLSSFGPTVFAILGDGSDRTLYELSAECEMTTLGIHSFANHGMRVSRSR